MKISDEKRSLSAYPKCSGSVLAEEYGYLDNKYNMGYNPRPYGFEKEYEIGYSQFRKIKDQTPPIPVGSYSNCSNWGWY